MARNSFRADRGIPRNCSNTVAMRHALHKLKAALNRRHTGNDRSSTRVSRQRVADLLNINKRTLSRWLDLVCWPSDAMLPRILGIVACLESAGTNSDDMFATLARNPFVEPAIVQFQFDTEHASEYNVPTGMVPEIFAGTTGWLGGDAMCGMLHREDPEASR